MLCLFGMISIGASAEEIPNNEIWYTSSDGSIIEPYASADFGATLLTNEYKNGKGVITFDGNVTTIGGSAFEHCENLTEVTIPSSVTIIAAYAFYGCSNLKELTLPSSITSINKGAFEDCINLVEVNLPSCFISENAFLNCSNLTTIFLSGCNLDWYAFSNCPKLSDVYVYDNIPRIFDMKVFNNSPVNNATLHVPVGTAYHYKNALTFWKNFGTIVEMGSDSPSIDIPEGICGDNLNWHFDTNTGVLSISGYVGVFFCYGPLV